jgi:putative toxin-antitoxin system antitoxin component (TIGR02293 family)
LEKKETIMHNLATSTDSLSADQLIRQLKAGLPVESFDDLRQRLDLSDNSLAQIVQIPKRTLSRRRVNGRLNTGESERVLRLTQVYEMAARVFGSCEKARRWLKKPARGLGGRIPLEYADTYIGADEVIKLLGRIDHGVFPG